MSDEHANMFFTIPSQPMGADEESAILLSTGCPSEGVETLLNFASKYRESISADNVQKNRKLGTRSLVRIARKIAKFKNADLHAIISNTLLASFLPLVERRNLLSMLNECNIPERNTEACIAYVFSFQLCSNLYFTSFILSTPFRRTPFYFLALLRPATEAEILF